MSQFLRNDNNNGANGSANLPKNSGNCELDPTLDLDWEALNDVFFDDELVGEAEEENCIRINPISSTYTVSQKMVSNSSSTKTNNGSAINTMNVAPASSFSTTSISSYLDRTQQYSSYSTSSYPTTYPPTSDLNQVSYVGSAGSSKKSVEFEEFLKTPAARELFEGSPMYSFSSIGQLATTPQTNNRKVKYEEAFGDDYNVYNNNGVYDDEGADGIKAMRGGSLGRVIASSVAAGSLVDKSSKHSRLFSGDGQAIDPSILKQVAANNSSSTSSSGLSKEEERKQLMTQFFQRLNRCDIPGLVKVIRHCDEMCLLSTPDVLAPVIGRSDIMMLMSLFIEAYPDGIWTPSTITLLNDTASCTYRFMGTRVFDHPINSLFRQIKTHIGTILVASNEHHQIDFFSNSMDIQRLVNEVTESAVPADSHHQDDIKLNNTNNTSMNNSNSTSSAAAAGQNLSWPEQQQHLYEQYHTTTNHKNNNNINNHSTTMNISSNTGNNVEAEEDNVNQHIMFRRRSRSLREVKAIETAVLEDGPTSYRRKIEFVFNDDNDIVQILFTNLL